MLMGDATEKTKAMITVRNQKIVWPDIPNIARNKPDIPMYPTISA
jgi:hypothetical protein